MARLTTERKAAAIGALVEGASIRATERMTGISRNRIGQLVLAYEPVWAIGTGRTATAAQAAEAHAHIRGRLRQWFGPEAAERCHLIYGGSVKPENTAELIAQPDVDGALVGFASFIPETITRLYDLVCAGDLHEAMAVQLRINPLKDAVYGSGEPTGDAHARMKMAMYLAGRMKSPLVQPPTRPPGDDEVEAIRRALDDAGLLRRAAAAE